VVISPCVSDCRPVPGSAAFIRTTCFTSAAADIHAHGLRTTRPDRVAGDQQVQAHDLAAPGSAGMRGVLAGFEQAHGCSKNMAEEPS
jgi:hypothetical protein